MLQKFLICLMTAVLLFTAGCENSNRVQTEDGKTISIEPKLPLNAQKVSQEVDAAAAESTCVGASVAAFENGKITYTYHYGYADKAKKVVPDDQTQYRIASLSKFVTAITIMTMVDDGKLELDEDISTYLGYTVRNPYYRDKPITMRMLLSHSSSIFDGKLFNESSGTNKQLLQAKSNFQGYEPGTGYEYSNFGIQAAGAVAELALGEEFNRYSTKRIFEPLGMQAAYLASELKDSSHIATIYNAKGAVSRSVEKQLGPKRRTQLGELKGVTQSSLTITPVDYAKLLLMVINGGEYDGVRILSKESADEILKMQYEDEEVSYGLCVRKSSGIISEKELYCHSGEAFGILSGFAFDRESKTGAVVATNGAQYKKDKQTGLFTGCRDIIRVIFENS